MRYGAILGCILAVAVITVSGCFTAIDSEPGYDAEYYCYTNELAFIYGGGTQGDVNVEWTAVGYDANGRSINIGLLDPKPSADNGWRVKFNPEDVAKCEYVYVNQFVTKDDKGDAQTFKIILLDPPETGKYTITFYDGYSGAALKVTEITKTGYVEVGKDHVIPPANPVRDGYSFIGWFVGSDLNQRFDSSQPVTSDINVYAKWSETPVIPIDITVYILLGIVVLLVVILAAVVIRMRKQRT